MGIKLVSHEQVTALERVAEAARNLPIRFKDGCGTCCWCKLDAALEALDRSQ